MVLKWMLCFHQESRDFPQPSSFLNDKLLTQIPPIDCFYSLVPNAAHSLAQVYRGRFNAHKGPPPPPVALAYVNLSLSQLCPIMTLALCSCANTGYLRWSQCWLTAARRQTSSVPRGSTHDALSDLYQIIYWCKYINKYTFKKHRYTRVSGSVG